METSTRTKTLTDTTARISRIELRTENVRVLARPEPPTVTSDTPLRDALAAMREARGDALLIVDDGRLVGIMTERDVLSRLLGERVDEDRPIVEYMTSDPRTVSADATLIEAMRAMEDGNYRNLPLIDSDGRLAGLLRQQDLLEYVAEAFPQEILNLPPRPHQLMEEPEGA